MILLIELKHWQLFLIIVGIPLLVMLLEGFTYQETEGEAFTISAVLRLAMVIPFLTFYFWLWSCGYLLNEKIKDSLNTHSSYFSLAVGTSAFATFFLTVYGALLGNRGQEYAEFNTMTYIGFGLVVFIALFTFLMAASFLAKTLVRAEREAHVKSADYYSEFIMILVFPIGIWMLQPRIQKAYHRLSVPKK
jgi:MFS family permease